MRFRPFERSRRFRAENLCPPVTVVRVRVRENAVAKEYAVPSTTLVVVEV